MISGSCGSEFAEAKLNASRDILGEKETYAIDRKEKKEEKGTYIKPFPK